MTEQNESVSSSTRLQISGATFDPSTGDVDFGEHQVRLAPKVADLLTELALARGAVLSKEALLARVWEDAYVGEDALWRCVSELRAALETGGLAESIETLPRRGYRLLAEVEEMAASEEIGPGSESVTASVSSAQDGSTSVRNAIASPGRGGWRWGRFAGLTAAAALATLALAMSGWQLQRPAAATHRLDSSRPQSTAGPSVDEATAEALAGHREQQERALAIRRVGGDPVDRDLTAVGFDALVRSASTENTEDSMAMAADIMLARGRPATAAQLYQAAFTAGATHSDDLRDRAQRAFQRYRTARAAAVANLPSQEPAAYVELARARRASEDLQGALAVLAVVLNRDPAHEPAILEFVRIQLALGELSKVRETLRRSLGLLPESVALLTVAAETELLVGDLPRALGFLDRACLAWERASREDAAHATLGPRPMLCWIREAGVPEEPTQSSLP